jgi:hypothetical protein
LCCKCGLIQKNCPTKAKELNKSKKKDDVPLLPKATAARKGRGRRENPRRILARRKPEFILQFRLFESIFGGGTVE